MPEATLIPIWWNEEEQTDFANLTGVKYVRVRDLSQEERAASREVYQQARQRLGPDKDNWGLGFNCTIEYAKIGGKGLAAAAAATVLGLWWLKRKT